MGCAALFGTVFIRIGFALGYILSINEKLPLTRVHLTHEHIWIFLDRELPSVQLSFLWCTVL